jgi:hypothetical protein
LPSSISLGIGFWRSLRLVEPVPPSSVPSPAFRSVLRISRFAALTRTALGSGARQPFEMAGDFLDQAGAVRDIGLGRIEARLVL